ncbi:MAG: deoxyguanosinetriphosphate triphosphohydrolase [Clostridia bacterium]|nr:deoxyguanosinetriphosphate triphosphohydrolase [Clostridia bacterium]
MNVRQMLEEKERQTLSELAVLSCASRGRDKPEEESPNRTCFMRDRDRIIHSKSFRRLKHKTQVFLSPEGDHYRTRLTHTLEVAQISRTIARALALNEDLAEAAALGHDLGHTPFGHAGERALNAMSGHFHHSEQSLRIVEHLEKDRQGLNLTQEVRNGIKCHTKGTPAFTLEGQIVRYADRIAYMNHDIDDAIRAGVLKNEDLPKSVLETLGTRHSQRIDTLVMGMIEQGRQTGTIGLPDELQQISDQLHEFMFEAVYLNPAAKSEEVKGVEIVKTLYGYYMKNPDRLPDDYRDIAETDGLNTAVCDFISGMTDRYAVTHFSELFIPKSWSKY